MTITTDMYLKHIRESLTAHDWHTVDIANKMALEINAITLDQYRLAARIILDAYYASKRKEQV